jgi:hypothetical protein
MVKHEPELHKALTADVAITVAVKADLNGDR